MQMEGDPLFEKRKSWLGVFAFRWQSARDVEVDRRRRRACVDSYARSDDWGLLPAHVDEEPEGHAAAASAPVAESCEPPNKTRRQGHA